jgi:hypothetical protein|tara:strand:- start:82 stop:444 length:363 start_codon:yes stop_codon:yes gene_type:complete
MAKVSNKWQMELSEINAVGHNIDTKLMTYAISGVAVAPETGRRYNFVVTNNLDVRYPDRFKVNWNGKEARMPVQVGRGVSDEVVEATGRKITPHLYMGRGGRIAVARWAKNLVADAGLEF